MTIKNALQEQLLKAGLANEKQLQKAHKKNKSKKTGKPKQRDNLAAAYAARTKAERKEQQEQARLAALKKANQKKILQLIKDNTLNDDKAKLGYQFTAGNNIKKVYVTETQRKALIEGELAITFLKGRRCLITTEIAEQIQQLDPEKMVILNAAEKKDENDPYADHEVPDDLSW